MVLLVRDLITVLEAFFDLAQSPVSPVSPVPLGLTERVGRYSVLVRQALSRMAPLLVDVHL